jgi:hypothetical protein
MIEGFKEFVDRQTPLSLFLALVWVIFAAMTCIETLQVWVLAVTQSFRPVQGMPLQFDGIPILGLFSYHFFKIQIQFLVVAAFYLILLFLDVLKR